MKKTITKVISILMQVSVLLLVHNCSGCKTENKKLTVDSKPIQFIDVKSGTIKGVIVPKEYFNDPNGDEHWTIKDFDFEELESRLENYLRTDTGADRWSKELPDKFRKYNRQYVGEIIDGRKKIFINFFCNDFKDDWKHRLILVDDGGDCYFQVKYDIQSGEFSNLWINGEA